MIKTLNNIKHEKSRRIVKKMSKKSLINKKALRYIIANSNLCKHAIREGDYIPFYDFSVKWYIIT